jgi:hypothetical protein
VAKVAVGVVDLVDLAGYKEVLVLAKELREDWAKVLVLVLKKQVVEEQGLLVQEVEVVYSFFLLYELEVGEERELHVVVQDLRANDYIGGANLYIQLTGQTNRV